MRDERWSSDAGEEDKLICLRGSDDEDLGYLEWNDMMDIGNMDLCVGMKYKEKI